MRHESTDPNVNRVILRIIERSQAGLNKYNTDTTRGDYAPIDWIRNMQEELSDALIYLEAYRRSKIIIGFKKLALNALRPSYKTAQAMGADICSVKSYDMEPGALQLVQTGLAFQPPSGVHLDLRIRSSIAKHSVILATGVGAIDCDYRGEVLIPLLNLGRDVFRIVAGARLAQVILPGGVQGIFESIPELTTTDRGEGGFGSTGK